MFLFVLTKYSLQKHPGSPKQQSEKPKSKPPLPSNAPSQFRKGTYHESLDFVHSLCETSYGLVDVFPIEDRKSALREVVPTFTSFFVVTLTLSTPSLLRYDQLSVLIALLMFVVTFGDQWTCGCCSG